MTQEEILCRFCLDSTNFKHNALISPCDCKGSMKFVHMNCLRRWRLLDPGRNGATCLLCFQAYTLINDDVLETLTNEKNMTVFLIRFPPVLCLFVNYIGIFHYTLLPARQQDKFILEMYQYFFQVLFFLLFFINWKVKHTKLYFTYLLTPGFCFLLFLHFACNIFIYHHDFMTGLIPMNAVMGYYYIFHKKALLAINNR